MTEPFITAQHRSKEVDIDADWIYARKSIATRLTHFKKGTAELICLVRELVCKPNSRRKFLSRRSPSRFLQIQFQSSAGLVKVKSLHNSSPVGLGIGSDVMVRRNVKRHSTSLNCFCAA